MKINVSKKTLCIFLAVSAIAVLFFVGSVVLELVGTKDYEKVSATITDLDRKISYGTQSGAKTKLVHYVEYSYEYNGNSYKTEQRTFLTFTKKIGKSTSIYCKSTDPAVTRNMFRIETGIIFSIFFALISLFFAYGIFSKKNN